MSDWLFFPQASAPLPAAVEDWAFSATPVEAWAITQTTGGYGRGADGSWVAFPPNSQRTYFDPVSLEDRGILIEPASYQTVYKPRTTALQLLGVTRTEMPGEPCPFGVGVFKLSAAPVAGNHTFNLLSGGTVAEHILENTTVTSQWIMKPDGLSRFTMFCQKKDAVYAVANFDMRGEGEVTGLVGCTATIERDVLGYFRMGMTVSSGVGTATFRFGGQMALDSGTRSFTGDGVAGFLVAYWGIERGDFMSSPSTADGGVATARDADSLVSSMAWVGGGPKSLGIEFTPLTGLDQVIFDAGLTDGLQLRIEGGNLRYVATTSGEAVAFLAGPTPPPGTPRAAVVTAGFDEFLLGHQGAILGVDRIGAAPTGLSQMRIGASLGGGGARPLAVKRVKFWSRALSEEATKEYSRNLSLAGEELNETIVTIQPSLTVPPDQNTVTVLVTLSDQNLSASVNYSTLNGTAVSGRDFAQSSGTLTFLDGELSKEITIQLGARAEEDREFKFNLSFPQNVTIDGGSCSISLLKAIRVPPVTSLDILFGDSVGADWTLTRPSPAPRRLPSGIWETVPANAPAAHTAKPGVSGVLIDAAGHDQCLFDSVLPQVYEGVTEQIDLVTQTPVGTRSVILSETGDLAYHGSYTAITTAVNGEAPIGPFTFWALVVPSGRTRYRINTKGIDNVWYGAVFDLTGAGSVSSVTPGAWAAVERDDFFSEYYRIGVGRGQVSSAGVQLQVHIEAVDEADNATLQGNTSNYLRISHMQIESRIGWGAPLVTAGVSARVVRAPDDMRPFGTWFKRDSYSIGIEATRLNAQPTIQRLLHIRDNIPYQDDYGIYINDTFVGAPTTTGTIYNGQMNGFTTVVGTPFTVILVVNPQLRLAMFQIGTKVGEWLLVNNIAAPTVVDNMRIGARLDGASLQETAILLTRMRYWEAPLNDAEGSHYSNNLTAGPLPTPAVLPVVSLPTSLRVREGEVVTVPILKNGDGACSVNYTTKAATAKFGIDYHGVGPVVMTFNPPDTQRTFTVATIPDSVSDNAETFTVGLSSPISCTLGNSTCVVTITEPPVVSVPLTAAVKEGETLTLQVVKSGEGACSVTWETKAVSATWNADYAGVNPTVLTFGETETSKAITVNTLQDAVSDPNEVFNVLLSAPSGCTLGNGTCAVKITDDEIATSGIYKRAKTFAGSVDAGIGKAVYRVTSLADTNTAGTLRYGINLGSRHIIFEVGGVIELQSDLSFTKADLTISGETAPYPGITLRGSATKGGSISMSASKRVHWSHINFERCHDARVLTSSNGDCLIVSPGNDALAEYIEFRHCSFFWSNDECVSLYPTKGKDASGKGLPDDRRGRIQNTSFADCMFSEALYRPEDEGYRAHYEGGNIESNHNYGNIHGINCTNIDVQYCMWTDMSWRCPFIDGGNSIVLANNIALNCGKGAHLSINTTYDYKVKPTLITNVGYLVISGPNNTTYNVEGMRIHVGNYIPPAGTVLWVDAMYGIKGPGSKITPGSTAAGNGVTTNASTQDARDKQMAMVVDITKVARPIDIPGAPVVALTADEIKQRAQDNIGPFPKKRIANLQRKIEHLKGNTGGYVNHETKVGGPSALTKATRVLDGNVNTKMDGVSIPAYPTIGNPATDEDKKKVRTWLEFFLSRIQYD